VVTSGLDRATDELKSLDTDYNNIIIEKSDDCDDDEESHNLIEMWDGMVFLAEEREYFSSMLPPIYESFTIALFHFWEKKVKQFGGSAVVDGNGHYNHDRAMGFLKQSGWNPDPKSLYILQLTANVAKHSSGSSAEKLLSISPSSFTKAALQDHGLAGHETLVLTHDLLHKFFIDVEQSYPI
jgi:hypothetical protein